MTVRWKPLLILSGLFVVVALIGLMTIATVMGSGGREKILARARQEVEAKEYEKAKLDYQRALKLDPKDASIHEEMAKLYEAWGRQAPPEKKGELRGLFLASLDASTKNNGAKRVEPRKRMLAEALKQDDVLQQVKWSKELITLDPSNRDAHFVLADDALDGPSPNIPEVRRHLKALDAETPRRARTEWIAARISGLENDQPRLEETLKRARTISLPPDADPVDRMSLLRLDALDVAHAGPGDVEAPVVAVARDALAASLEPEIPTTRIGRISLMIEEVQRTLARKGQDNPADRDALKAQAEKLDEVADTIFRKSLEAKGGADLNVYLAYADHLRFRDRRDRCLAVALEGLKSPAATKQSGSEAAMGLHGLAVEASLSNAEDQGRFAASSPHIKALLECKSPRFQALGHLFQGAIDLEKAGMVADAQQPGEISKADQAKLRASALDHLKKASAQLPHLAEAQARYGVALILNQEPAMGRQYLQLAQRLGNLEPQYQIWAAWSVVQAGYPEDAEPIVARMIEDVKLGRLPRELEGTLHLLSGEIHQSRRSPKDLNKAIEEYGRAFAGGQDATPAVELRLAQIEVMLGRPAKALERIDWLVSQKKAGPAAENLAVLTLQELKREGDARKRVDAARVKFPESAELAVLDASMLLKGKKFEDADKVLAGFLAKVPDSVPAVQMRAQVLARDLDRPGEARKLLSEVAERGDNSAPLVQLALLEIGSRDFEAAAASIARVRSRWKDAASGDLLDAQLCLARNDQPGASGYFDAALKKDPNNKIVQFWKAQLDGRADPEAASKVFESLAQTDSIKELEVGVTLAAASQSALASIAMEGGDLDSAIARYREMLKDGSNVGLSRVIRWQIVAALAAKKEWPAARAEIDVLLKDPKSPPTSEELVRAATFHRLNREDDAALKLADRVIQAEPTFTGAVVTRAEILARQGKHAEAIATVNRSIEAYAKLGKPAPSVLYLMMAAVEAYTPPVDQGFRRALIVLEKGLELEPGSIELVQAKCRVLTITQGPKAGSAFIEERAKANPKGPFRRMLMKVYADQGDLASAERVAAELAKESPTDLDAAATQVRMIAGQSMEATGRGDRPAARKLDDKAAALIYENRSRFKGDPTFVQLDCELELRRGDTTRALALTQELDSRAKASPVGPLLRAQIFASKGQSREAAAAFDEALARNPRLPEARLQLARLRLRNGETDEALRQAKYLVDADPDKPTGMAALLVEARAIASQPGTPAQVQANRARAIEKLSATIKDRPDFADAYHLAADVHMIGGDRARAVAVLKDALKANPDDSTALAMAVQVLADPRDKAASTARAELDQAVALARLSAEADPKGGRMLAASNGFSRAGRVEQAIPWAEKAVANLGSIPSRLNLGDLLLTRSEAPQVDPDQARQLQDRAMEQYDKVLEAQPNVIEAVNNKAWILHRYRRESRQALELAQGLLQRVDPNSLPGEFYDTLGSIQEELKRPRDAEESYKKGLGKSPEHPVLNYHMGRLMASDKARSRKAADYLKVAQIGSERLPADMAANLPSLLKQVGE